MGPQQPNKMAVATAYSGLALRLGASVVAIRVAPVAARQERGARPKGIEPQRVMMSPNCRPGSEFGTGLLFPAAGCWVVHVTVGQLTGDVYVVVS
jgi:hypothetical protein